LGDNYEGKYFWDYSRLHDKYNYIELDFSGDSEILVKESTINNLASSIIKKYSGVNFYPGMVASSLDFDGDSAGGYRKECNYPDTYGLPLKYVNPIEYKVAASHDYTEAVLDLAINRKKIIFL
jgi:hypothetical protein